MIAAEPLVPEGEEAPGHGGSVIEAAYSRMRMDILAGLLPPGSRLRLDALRTRYDTSINTLREALARLVADGLVQSEGQRGYTVVPASLADLRDITETRRMLECQAVRLSLERADLDWEGRVVAAYHMLSRIEAVVDDRPHRWADRLEDYNRNFHTAIISACGSRWLLRLHGMMYDQSLRYRMLALQVRDFPREQSRREHHDIMQAALAQDADRLVAILNTHITKGADLYLHLSATQHGEPPLDPIG